LERRLGGKDFKELVEGTPENYIGGHTMIGPRMQKIMDAFEVIKRDFQGDLSPLDQYVALPEPLNRLADDEPRGIKDGEIRVTR
jgi:hypothetical protein